MEKFSPNIFIGLLIISGLLSCKRGGGEVDQNQELFRLLTPDETGISFVNEVQETRKMNMLTYRNFFNGGGVAVGDINNDGFSDIYLTANQQKNRLYLNKGNLKFEDITDKAGVGGSKPWSTGVSMADVNGDGWLDIYVCNSGDADGKSKENELFINNGNGTFTEKAESYGLNDSGYGTHAAFFDYDRDGDLDCYILNNSFKEPGRIELYRSMREIPDKAIGDKLMRNDGGIFTDVTEKSGIFGSAIGFGLGVATSDLNGDLWPDIYISNDFWERDYLYLNNGDGTFKEDLIDRTDLVSTSSMGADIADINGDGAPDIFTTDMLAASQNRIQSMMIFEPYHLEDLKYRANYHYQFTQNSLHLNNGKGDFQEISNLAGVSATDWSWGALIFDFQNDGYNDIFVSNGIGKDILDGDFREYMEASRPTEGYARSEEADLREYTKHMPSTPVPNYAFIGNGSLNFQNKSAMLGLGEPLFSNGSVYADLDNDGDLELILNNNNQPASVYQNLSSEEGSGNYLKISFKGKAPNVFGVGAKVKIESDGKVWVKENFTNRGFQSSIEPQLLFGLGNLKSIEKLTVIWPDGSFEVKKAISSNTSLVLDQNSAAGLYASDEESKPFFEDVTASYISGDYFHRENVYNDFNKEILLNRMLSTESPRLIKGDVNRDGKDDFLMLGARGDADKLFVQNNEGKFISSNTSVFERDKDFESTCAAFFDFEGDGDMDLLIGSGGNEPVDALNYIVRLYLNDGRGNFEVDPAGIPPVIGNFSTLEVADFDSDGYTDVFLGARCVVGSYGVDPQSYLLKNNGGAWQDVTPSYLSKPGMVTDAGWTDIDKNGTFDLILVGDWMPVIIYKNTGNALSEPKEIPNSAGWWTRIEQADLDSDGDLDFILGNWGQNSKFRTSVEMPVNMRVADFDGNGKSEFIINWNTPDNEGFYPWASRAELTAQLPSLKKKKVKYSDFAKMKYENLFDSQVSSNASTLRAETLSNSVLWNDNGNFRLQEMPMEAQFSPVFGITVHDFDGDGQKEIFLAGNFYGLKPQMGRHAAGRGILLKQSKKGSFTAKSLGLKGEFRDAIVINNLLLVSRNNDRLMVLKHL